MDAVLHFWERHYCFSKIEVEYSLLFIYHNADSDNNKQIVTLIKNKVYFTIGHDLPKL